MKRVVLRYFNQSLGRASAVSGFKVGPFGVHLVQLANMNTPPDIKDGDYWTVTHLPTGHAIADADTKAEAMRIASALKSSAWNSPKWEFGVHPLPKPLPRHAAVARAELRRVRDALKAKEVVSVIQTKNAKKE